MSVQQLKTIKRFTFGIAYYHVSDGQGDNVVLEVDYARNTFSVKAKGNSAPNPAFRKEIHIFASDLLKRKHGINFAR